MKIFSDQWSCYYQLRIDNHLSDAEQENLGDGIDESARLDSLAHNASPVHNYNYDIINYNYK